ncbi:hypothetical protein L249_2689 [Ophiocordyceps polyrhachis-furcata BCC 54312]|uniref:PAS domain-containing protein n=1 Tax=Ophiocordyceps polyrhachis-furcata BCC 54312 TaxID=1330021 RepID=A0A367LQF8_9HYPO|nr:hypothetical protein L249_2689 [Ophiocordyceps polyrhachis-furcata BCC 54312]
MASASEVSQPPLNPWESRALDHRFAVPLPVAVASSSRRQPRSDPLIYPGLYSASGFDLMNLLFRIISRPNPQIELGAVDCSVALVVCDLQVPDCPIVYASDSFCEMTGYSKAEVLGRNCRFLQYSAHHPSGPPSAKTTVAAQQIRQAMESGREVQVMLQNYKKNGQLFNNFLSIIPVEMNSRGHRYAVGFQVQVD